MLIQYLGHSAFYFEEGDVKGLIDPFLPKPIDDKAYQDSDIDYIFVTHGHGDHIGDTINIAKASGALVICNFELAQYFGSKELQCHSMHIGGRVKTDFGRVKMTPALHGSGINTPEGMLNGGSPCGFVIEINGKTIYHAGDTGLTMDMKLLEYENIDIALLPIGGNFTMDIDDAVRAVDFIKPKRVIPMHYNTFPIISASPEEFADKVGRERVIIMGIGEKVKL